MSNLKEQYDDILSKKEDTEKQISELENSDVLKRYFSLCNLNIQLEKQQENLYEQIKVKEYSSCNHIWVITSHDSSCEGRSYNYCGCIKCGLDERIIDKINEGYPYRALTLEERTMYDFMKDHFGYYEGIRIKNLCDFDLAKAIYTKIKEAHPNIDDETARKYFEVSLNDISEIKVNDERKTNRAKSLSLDSKFNKWRKY